VAETDASGTHATLSPGGTFHSSVVVRVLAAISRKDSATGLTGFAMVLGGETI
jgi:hypothetical protein